MDPQREHVYRAEARVDHGAQLYSEHQIRRYVRAVTSSSWWSDHDWPAVRVVVAPGAVDASGGWSPGPGFYLRLPAFASPEVEDAVVWSVRGRRPVRPDHWPWAWREQILCHELAHVSLTADDVEADHGPVFAARYLETIAAVRGPGCALDLARAFAGEEVDVGEMVLTVGEPLSPLALTEAGWHAYEPDASDDAAHAEREYVEQAALLL